MCLLQEEWRSRGTGASVTVSVVRASALVFDDSDLTPFSWATALTFDYVYGDFRFAWAPTLAFDTCFVFMYPCQSSENSVSSILEGTVGKTKGTLVIPARI